MSETQDTIDEVLYDLYKKAYGVGKLELAAPDQQSHLNEAKEAIERVMENHTTEALQDLKHDVSQADHSVPAVRLANAIIWKINRKIEQLNKEKSV